MANKPNLSGVLLSRLAAVKNVVVAHAIGSDESFVSRFATGERGLRIAQLEPFLESLGLKVIECDGELVQLPQEEYQALLTLARKALK